LVTEQNNEFLMENHKLRPNGSTPFPEVNKTIFPEVNSASSHKYGRGRGRARGRGKFCGGGHNRYVPNVPYKNTLLYQKWTNIKVKKENEKKIQAKAHHYHHEDACYRCGKKGHWSRTCRTLKHLVDLYKRRRKRERI